MERNRELRVYTKVSGKWSSFGGYVYMVGIERARKRETYERVRDQEREREGYRQKVK